MKYYSKFFFTLVVVCTSLFAQASDVKVGLSCARPVLVKTVASEYEWVQKHYPDSKVVGQKIGFCFGKLVDILTVRTSDGSDLEVYFDISELVH